ncbi:MAG: cyclopropane fatty acyl phospholipid synthase [bacterium]|nr:cyclopropane fatty acyl phospholipid synthase [bacterium]
MGAKQQIEKYLAQAGLTINGPNSWDLQVHNEKLYGRVLKGGSLALGEAYMDGWWDVEQLDEFFYRLLSPELWHQFTLTWPIFFNFLRNTLLNLESPSRSFKVGQEHYDIGNDVYEAMLDKRLVYTCGYWKEARNLEEAQEAKLDLVARKIGLKENDSVLDIGCGWGSFLKFAAEKYGARGTGVTVSKNQVELGKKLCQGLPVDIKLEDYRKTAGEFDHIISLGMFEHVGAKNYRTYMQQASRLLKDDGLFLLHTIGVDAPMKFTDPWVEKYIFPNSILPAPSQIAKSIEGLFVIEDWHNFGADYDKTLMAWFENFDRAWPKLRAHYSERFYRMWKYYLLSFAGSFRGRNLQLWQIVLSKRGVKGGYKSVR